MASHSSSAAPMISSSTVSVEPSVSAEQLLSPYIREVAGPVRILEANLECVEKGDGLFHYVYKLRAEALPEEPVVRSSPASSQSSLTSVATSHSVSAGTSRLLGSSRSTTPTCPSVASVQSPVASTLSGISPRTPSTVGVKFTITSGDGSENGRIRAVTGHLFDRDVTIRDVIYYFRQKNEEFFRDVFSPRLSMVISGNSYPITMNHLQMSVEELVPMNNKTFEIVADVM